MTFQQDMILRQNLLERDSDSPKGRELGLLFFSQTVSVFKEISQKTPKIERNKTV